MEPKFKIVFVDHHGEPIEKFQQEVEKAGGEITYPSCRKPEDILQAAAHADGLMSGYLQIDRSTISSLKKCKVILRIGIGYDNIDVGAATDCGIFVCNVPDYCVDEVSDHALSLILASWRRIEAQSRYIKKGIWNYRKTGLIYPLKGSTLGLVAFGKIARALSGKVKSLGLKVIAYDPYLPDDIFQAFGVERAADLDSLIRQSDIISLHTPLNAETRGMFGEREFRMMKNTAHFVNTSRGAVADEEALYRALKEGWIAGAGIDAFEKEPLPSDSLLLSLDNIILTPHIAWYSERSIPDLHSKAIAEIIRILEGNRPRYIVNPQVLA
jgi:D-3-phosphoglycerate dehydrogenase